MSELKKTLRTAALSQDCALLLLYENTILGGQGLGFVNNHRTRLFINTRKQDRRFVGFNIELPLRVVGHTMFRRPDNHPKESLEITIMLHAGSFAALFTELSVEEIAMLPPRVAVKGKRPLAKLDCKLKDGMRAAICHWRVPAICVSEMDQAILDRDERVTAS